MSRLETILVVDDQPDFAAGLARLIGSRFPGHKVLEAHDGAMALERIREHGPELLFTDLRMPGISGQELLEQALRLDPRLTVVMLTAHGDVESAVTALKAGAYDFLTKPVEPASLFRAVQKGLERARLISENRRLRQSVAASEAAQELIGDSPSMQRLKKTIAAVAGADYTVLIQGESGTGKELVAHTIHRLSKRGDGPMLSVNCPAIPEQLLESELFGHVKGAFTGAEKASEGLFLAAQGGTFLLDEIGDIPMPIQTKLLRVLQEREVRPVGGSQTLPVDVRILASTNQHLERKIKEHSFREDLFYRLNVLTIQTPPLRERREDIPLLAMHFLQRSCQEMRLAQKDIAPDGLAYLAGREWPGNVRELLNFVRRLVVFAPGDVIDAAAARLVDGGNELLRAGYGGETTAAAQDGPGGYQEAKNRVLEAFTRTYVDQLLTRTRGNISEAARVSGLERVSLQKILKRLSIEAREFKNS